MNTNRIGSLVFIDDVTTFKSSRINFKVYQVILLYKALDFTVYMDNDLRHAKITQGDELSRPHWSPDLNSIEQAFLLLQAKLKSKHHKNKQEPKPVAVES